MTFAAAAGFLAVVLGALAVARQQARHLGDGGAARALIYGWFLLALAASSLGMALGADAFPVAVLPIAVIGLLAGRLVVGLRARSFRASEGNVAWRDRYGMQIARLDFGAVILVGAAGGLLPWEFARGAGAGDIAVGLAAVALRRLPPSHAAARPLALVFCALGLADLANALRVAARSVVPWLITSQKPPILLMLPFFVVPLLLAQHLLMLRQMRGMVAMRREGYRS
jgi:hypothetical protein